MQEPSEYMMPPMDSPNMMAPQEEPEQPPMNDDNAPTDDESDNLGGDESGNEIQSDASKLGQEISKLNSKEAASMLNQVNSVGAKALSQEDVDNVVSKIKDAAEGNSENDDEANPEDEYEDNGFQTESIGHINKSKLDEMIDSIIQTDSEKNKNREPTKVSNSLKGKNNPFSPKKFK